MTGRLFAVTSAREYLTNLPVLGANLACAVHDGGGDRAVVFCHGFRGEKTGPNRTFVRTARRLAQCGISSFRFDQYGSGDSPGDFRESRFDRWISTICALIQHQRQLGRRVALLGQSMGATAAICAAAREPVEGLVAWVPDANVDAFTPGLPGYVEEGGQQVDNEYWEQAHAIDVPRQFELVAQPCYLVFGTADEYVSEQNRAALVSRAKPEHAVDVFEGWSHSAWTAQQADTVITRSVDFLARILE